MTTQTEIRKVGIAGAGTMGTGIAQVSALAGYEVVVYDIGKERIDLAGETVKNQLDKGVEKGKVTPEARREALERIAFTSDWKNLTGELIIEAIIENPEEKQKLYDSIYEVNAEEVLLATNTSSLPVTQLASTVKYPERFLGIHFFNPAHVMKLVEVVQGIATSQSTVDTALHWVKSLGKTPALVQDSPGFIVNRVARNFYTETLRAVEEKAVTIDGADRLMEASGFRMGPFRLMDLIGVDTNHRVTTTMYEQYYYEPRFQPSKLQKKMVDAGHYGRKSGRGFYEYD